MSAPARQGLEGAALEPGQIVFRAVDGGDGAGPVFADAGELAAGDHNPFRVHHTYGSADAVLHLEYNTLKHPARHSDPSYVNFCTLFLL